MDVGEQCVVRNGGTQRLVWSVLDWDSQEKVSIKELLRLYIAHTELKRKLLLTGAIITQYSQGTLQSIYTLTCPFPQSNPPDCTAIPALDSCDHTMDLGVRCSSHQEVCESSSGPVSSTNCTESTQAMKNNCSCTTMPEDGLSTLPVSTEREPTSLAQFFGELITTNQALGALTGLLAAALVVVTMGWIVSCVYLRRRIKQR